MSSHPFISSLRALGIQKGDTVLVHSSLRSLGRVSGGAEAVVGHLMQAVGDTGTLLMPALSYEYVHERQPLFSRQWTGTCVGVIPETFRRMKGVLRSIHPTHSVCAAGARAEELTESHCRDRTPVGPSSPFTLLPHVGGKILMLGCGLMPNTSMHGVEELVEPPYLFREQTVRYVICEQGQEVVVVHRRHDFRGYAQRYDRVAGMGDVLISSGRVLSADCFLLDATSLWRSAEQALRQDPMCLVEKQGG